MRIEGLFIETPSLTKRMWCLDLTCCVGHNYNNYNTACIISSCYTTKLAKISPNCDVSPLADFTRLVVT